MILVVCPCVGSEAGSKRGKTEAGSVQQYNGCACMQESLQNTQLLTGF